MSVPAAPGGGGEPRAVEAPLAAVLPGRRGADEPLVGGGEPRAGGETRPAGEPFAGGETRAAEAPLAGGPVAVLADDLIWATRLVGQLTTLGARPVRVASLEALSDLLAGRASPDRAARPGPVPAAGRAVIDLTARAYDGVAAVRAAAAAGWRVLAVGQHDDLPLRRAALAAGAERVFAYRKLFEDGHATLAGWLGVPVPAVGSRDLPSHASTPEAPPR